MTDEHSRFVRTPINEESIEERRTTFEEVLQPYSLEDAVLEAQRCIQCAMPYCVQACPIDQDCRGYIALIAQRRFDDAATLTLQDNPLATVLCKSCYHYCQEDCIMGGRGVPIAIRHLKRAALEFGRSDQLYVPSAPRNKRVAIVGAGPAGLMAAWELCLRGYSITVYDSETFLGGQIATIPKYHQGDNDLATDLARFGRLDISFVTGKRAGVDFTPEGLLKAGYLAVFIAIGAWDPRPLEIPGEELPGVFSALPFLLAVNQGPDGLFGRKGRKVVVIGGGDVGLDAARSSLRLARRGDVTVVYRRTQEEMPAGPEEKTGGAEEGINFLFQRAPVRIIGSGHVEGIVLQRTEPGPPDSKGRPSVVTVPGTEETVACDTVIIAVGETADVSRLSPELNFKFSSMGWPEGKREGWMTDIDGVFAFGGKSVVYAMGAGTAAAVAIDTFLQRKIGQPPTVRTDAFGRGKLPKLPEGYGGPTWHL